ncbi:hypothetical protein N434_04510 [Rhizobium sp. UGM030330-04]|nr:hypothetical protein N434_04510 [Rhizobium sp. UGM030330-04]
MSRIPQAGFVSPVRYQRQSGMNNRGTPFSTNRSLHGRLFLACDIAKTPVRLIFLIQVSDDR